MSNLYGPGPVIGNYGNCGACNNCASDMIKIRRTPVLGGLNCDAEQGEIMFVGETCSLYLKYDCSCEDGDACGEKHCGWVNVSEGGTNGVNDVELRRLGSFLSVSVNGISDTIDLSGVSSVQDVTITLAGNVMSVDVDGVVDTVDFTPMLSGISANANSIIVLSNNISSLDSRVSMLEGQITGVVSDINSVTQDLTLLQSRVLANEVAIGVNTVAISNINTEINNIEYDVTGLQTVTNDHEIRIDNLEAKDIDLQNQIDSLSPGGGSEPLYTADKPGIALNSTEDTINGVVNLNNGDGSVIPIYSTVTLDNMFAAKADVSLLSDYVLDSTYQTDKTTLTGTVTDLDTRLTAEELKSSTVETTDGVTYTFKDKNGTAVISWTIDNTSLFTFIGDVATVADLPTGQVSGTVAHVVDEDKLYLYNGTSWVPLTLSIDLSDYYNKAEVDAKLDTKVGNAVYSVDQALQNTQITGLDTRVANVETEISTLEKKHTFSGTAGVDGIITVDNGVTQDSTYDKATIDSKIASGGTFDPTNYYTKTDIDTKFGEYYTKTEIDAAVTALDTKFGDYYLKTEVDILLAGKVDTTAFDSSQTAQDLLISGNTSDISALDTRVTTVEGDIATINTELASKVNTTDFEASQSAQDTVIDSKVNTTTFNLSQGLQDNRITNIEEDLTDLQLKLSSIVLDEQVSGPLNLSTTPTVAITFPAIVNPGEYNGFFNAVWNGTGTRDVSVEVYIDGVALVPPRISVETVTNGQTIDLNTSTPLVLSEGQIVTVLVSSAAGNLTNITSSLQLVIGDSTIDLSAYETVADHTTDINDVNNRIDNVENELDTKVSNVTFTTGQATQNARITTNEGNIATNTTDIATNASNISGLDTRVTINESDITDLQTKDVDLQTQIDNIEASRVFDYVVPTFADLPITAVDDELALVLSDTNYSNLPTYYKWVTSTWVYQANYNKDYYTKAESDTTNGIQDTNISTNASAITDLDTRVGDLEALPVASVFTESADDTTAIADSTADPDGFYFVVEV